MTLQNFGIGVGVLGFCISVWNWLSAIRNRTVNPQPQLLAELRSYLDLTVHECQQVKHRLGFDRHQLYLEQKPEIPPRPQGFDQAVERMPELGFTITSVGQKQVEMLLWLIREIRYNWDNVNSCLDSDPMNTNALEFSEKLKRYCLLVEKFFPAYADAVRDINKGKVWKRFRYRDHGRVVCKVFRWTPLNQAVSEYDRALRGD
jgi:hypothetical protein